MSTSANLNAPPWFGGLVNRAERRSGRSPQPENRWYHNAGAVENRLLQQSPAEADFDMDNPTTPLQVLVAPIFSLECLRLQPLTGNFTAKRTWGNSRRKK